jgi:hypothetical protein
MKSIVYFKIAAEGKFSYKRKQEIETEESSSLSTPRKERIRD